MTHRMRTALLVLGLACVATKHATAQASQPCLATTASLQPLVDWSTRVATGTDTIASRLRTMSHLPATASANIAVVTDSATCQHAAAAYTAAVKDSSMTRRVFVVRVDSVYVALDPDFEFGEWSLRMTLGSTFAVLAKLTY